MSILATALSAAAFAFSPAVRDVDINILLTDDGTALVTESWDVTVTSGTEWYLVRENLSDIAITDLTVIENGSFYINEGDWNVERTISQKAGRCGIVRKGNGCEICWGVGSYGDHSFTVAYRMTNAVKALDDYDLFHIQLVCPGLSSPPQHARAEIRLEKADADSTNTRIWGFGFYGNATITGDGSIVLESSEPFSERSSLIAMLRIDKGILHPVSIRHTTFQEVQDRAFKGSAYSKVNGSLWPVLYRILLSLLFPIVLILIPLKLRRKAIMNMIGTSRKRDIPWSRDIPFGGDLASADYILGRLGERRIGNNVASAMILRMLQKGCLAVRQDEKGRTEITFGNEESLSEFSGSERKLWIFMKQASGSDEVLQNREFSRWSGRHTSDINNWLTELSLEGEKNIIQQGYKSRGKYTPEGQAEARKALGLKKFLSEYTLIKERASGEAVIWQDYLVFGAMFGIADKVAAELKDINPTMFQEVTMYDYTTMRRVLDMSDSLARSITNAKASYDRQQMSKGSAGGFGGVTSFGGGGGFSGGGFGGGSR